MPAELDGVIRKALAKDPDDRYQSVTELQKALHSCDPAQGWAPPPAAPAEALDPSAGPADLPTPSHPDDLPAAYRDPCLTIEPRREGAVLILDFLGELDEPGTALLSFFDRLSQLMPDPVERVILDLGRLGFAGAEGQACLLDWLSFLAGLRADGLLPVTVRYSESISWQREALSRMRATDPALRVEPID